MKVWPLALIAVAGAVVGVGNFKPDAEITILAVAVWLAYGVHIYLSRRE